MGLFGVVRIEAGSGIKAWKGRLSLLGLIGRVFPVEQPSSGLFWSRLIGGILAPFLGFERLVCSTLLKVGDRVIGSKPRFSHCLKTSICRIGPEFLSVEHILIFRQRRSL